MNKPQSGRYLLVPTCITFLFSFSFIIKYLDHHYTPHTGIWGNIHKLLALDFCLSGELNCSCALGSNANLSSMYSQKVSRCYWNAFEKLYVIPKTQFCMYTKFSSWPSKGVIFDATRKKDKKQNMFPTSPWNVSLNHKHSTVLYQINKVVLISSKELDLVPFLCQLKNKNVQRQETAPDSSRYNQQLKKGVYWGWGKKLNKYSRHIEKKKGPPAKQSGGSESRKIQSVSQGWGF